MVTIVRRCRKAGHGGWILHGRWWALLLVVLVSLVPSVWAERGMAPGTGMSPAETPYFSVLQSVPPSGPDTSAAYLNKLQAATGTGRIPVLPVLRNRTAAAEALAKNAARPKVTIAVGVLIAIVVIAGTGMFALAYFLFGRRKRQKDIGTLKEKEASPAALTATLIPEIPDQIAGNGEKHSRNGPDASLPPSLEKRFLNPEFIGEGGIARVFRAQNAKTGKTVAVKVPQRFDELTGTHFARDIILWQDLVHENIIGIYSTNILPVPYIEMEYAPTSLAAMKFPISEQEALRIITGVARGLAFAHGKGVVHRDLKPENILIADDGTPKITDWGLGKSLSDPRQSTMIGYSPGYAAPEQVAPHQYCKPGAATDIYQIGILLTELLTGTIPFARKGVHDTNTAILNDPAPEPSWAGRHVPEIRTIIRRCLARRPEDRYGSAAELLADLEAACHGSA